MPENRDGDHSRLTTILTAGSVALIALLTYRDILDYQFTGTDWPTILETSRIRSPGDLARIFTRRYMDAPGFPGMHYRPMSTLSFALDYAIWGLSPLGYHLTNLVAHAALSVVAVVFVGKLTHSRAAGWLGAAIFAMHPVGAEVVPGVDNRQDVLAALFVLLCLLAFLKCIPSRRGMWGYQLLSSGLCVGAVWTKENAFLLPALALTLAYLIRPCRSFMSRLAAAVRTSLPIMVAALGAFLWRHHVLGVVGTAGDFGKGFWRLHLTIAYMADLICADRMILEAFGGWHRAAPLARAISTFACVLLLAYAARTFWKGSVPVQRNGVLFLITWALLPLAPSLMSRNFSPRHAYYPALPYAGLLGLLAAANLRTFRTFLSRGDGWRRGLWRRGSLVRASAAAGAISVILLVPLVAFSPLVGEYREWRCSGKLSRMFLNDLVDSTDSLPSDAVLVIHGLPSEISLTGPQGRRLKRVAALFPWSIASWLRLKDPSNRMEVVIRSTRRLQDCNQVLRLTVEQVTGRNYRIFVSDDEPADTGDGG